MPVLDEVKINFESCDGSSIEDQNILVPAGVIFYQKFVKWIIILLVLHFFVVDCYLIFSSTLNGKYCLNLALAHAKHQCGSFTVSGYNLKSIANQIELNISSVLNFIFTIISICYFLALRKWFLTCEDYKEEK